MTSSHSRQPQRRSALEDFELMDLVRTGDRLAFREIYDRHSERVYAYAWRMARDTSAAEDIRQEAFMRLWQGRERWTDRGSVAGYLIHVTRNLVINAGDTARTRQNALGRLATAPRPASESPADVLEQSDLCRRVDDAVASLPGRAREVFMMKRDGGLSYGEISTLLGITSKTVEAHMGRAYSILRQRLADLRNSR